jgi:hypothetical protein
MPNLPMPGNTVGATTELPRATADGNNFGAQAGRAMQDLGDAGAKAALAYADEKRAEEATNNVAQFDYSKRMLEAQTSWQPSGEGFADFIRSDYVDKVDKHVNTIKDNKARKAARDRLMGDLPQITASSAKWEFGRRESWSREEANRGLQTQENIVRTAPDALDKAIRDSDAVIDSRGDIPVGAKPEMKRLQSEKLVRARFEALVEAAKTPEEYDGILADLKNPEKGWQSRMKPEEYDKLVDSVISNKKTARTEATAAARSAVESLRARNNDGSLIDIEELSGVEQTVRASNDPGLARELYDIKATQDIYRRYPSLKPSELRAKAQQFRSGAAPGVQNAPAEIATIINEAAALTGVPASYLVGTASRESNFNPNAQAETSSATGLFQHIDSTWLQIVKGNGGDNARLMGIDLAGKSDSELLAMRRDPRASAIGGAIYAKQNAVILSGGLGRAPTDGELYTAHFLGPGGAAAFFRALKTNPDAPGASAVNPDQVAANRSIFYRKDGTPYTVAEVAANLEASFSTAPGRAAYVQSEAFNKMATQQATALKNDPMGYVANLPRSNIAVPEFNAENAAAYGRAALAVAEFYEIPMSDFKPLRAEDAGRLSRAVKDGTAEEALAAMAELRGLGGDVAKAAYKQIGEEDKVFSFAAGLAHERPSSSAVAADVIRGRKRIEADPKVLGGESDEFRAAFDVIMGRALGSLEPVAAGAAYDAALAHYVETYVTRGAGKLNGINQAALEASANAVLGGTAKSAAIGEVNGEKTILPAGISDMQFEAAIDRMKTEDYTRMSVHGTPPRFGTGEPILPEDIAREGKFRAIGAGQYRIQMGDGKYAMSLPGKMFVFKPNTDELLAKLKADPTLATRAATQDLLREPWKKPN